MKVRLKQKYFNPDSDDKILSLLNEANTYTIMIEALDLNKILLNHLNLS